MFPEWFRKLVLTVAVFVIIASTVYFVICPPCYFCFGFKFGEVCGETIGDEPPPLPQPESEMI